MLGNAVHVGVIPVKAWRLVGRKGHVVLERLAGIDERLDHLIGVASRRSVGAMVVNVERRKGHVHSARAAVGRIDGHVERTRWRIVGHRNDQVIARFHVQRGVLQAARGHEAKQVSASGVGCRLIRKLNGQHAVLTEQRRRLVYHAARGESRAGIRDGWH
jgi:hypothetical protein